MITGIGSVSALGVGTETTFTRAVRGQCGIDVADLAAAGGAPVRLRGKVDDRELDSVSEAELAGYDRAVVLALNAAREAWSHAGTPEVDATRLAVSVSAGIAGAASLMSSYQRQLGSGSARVPAGTLPRIMPNAVAAVLAIELRAGAGTYSPVSACSSGADAIAQAYRLLATGEADVVVAGGAEALLHPYVVAGFAALRTLSRRHESPELAARPFDRARSGFVLAEGAGILVLETRRHAQGRGARVLAGLRGIGVTSDGYKLTIPDPDGAGAARAMRSALATGDLGPADVAAVSAHATGTRVGDAAETKALSATFGRHLDRVLVTGLKSMVGHAIGGSGALAAAVAARGLTAGLATPTPNFTEADPGTELNIPNTPAPALPRNGAGAVLVNSFGFGGQNVCLCLAP